MSTKYILHGGYTWKVGDEGEAFCHELVKSLEGKVKILDCLFARPREIWDERFIFEKEHFEKYLGGKVEEVRLAQPESFIEQVRWADILYIAGGDAEVLLVEFLNALPDLKKEFEGKVIAGSSAGADALAKYFYGLDHLKVMEGLGLVPVKALVHYRSDYNAPNIDWDKAKQDLKEHKEDLPLVCLKEGEFKVFEQ